VKHDVGNENRLPKPLQLPVRQRQQPLQLPKRNNNSKDRTRKLKMRKLVTLQNEARLRQGIVLMEREGNQNGKRRHRRRRGHHQQSISMILTTSTTITLTSSNGIAEILKDRLHDLKSLIFMDSSHSQISLKNLMNVMTVQKRRGEILQIQLVTQQTLHFRTTRHLILSYYGSGWKWDDTY